MTGGDCSFPLFIWHRGSASVPEQKKAPYVRAESIETTFVEADMISWDNATQSRIDQLLYLLQPPAPPDG